jgi:hypothetical protein
MSRCDRRRPVAWPAVVAVRRLWRDARWSARASLARSECRARPRVGDWSAVVEVLLVRPAAARSARRRVDISRRGCCDQAARSATGVRLARCGYVGLRSLSATPLITCVLISDDPRATVQAVTPNTTPNTSPVSRGFRDHRANSSTGNGTASPSPQPRGIATDGGTPATSRPAAAERPRSGGCRAGRLRTHRRAHRRRRNRRLPTGQLRGRPRLG